MFDPVNGSRRYQMPNQPSAYNVSQPLGAHGNGAGRPLRSVHARVLPGQYLTPNDSSQNGKKMYPAEATANQYIAQEAVRTDLFGGIRKERLIPIRESASHGILKPNAAMINNSHAANDHHQNKQNFGVAAAPSSMPQNLSNQLQNDMRYLMNQDNGVGASHDNF